MPKCRYTHANQEQCQKVAKLRQQGLTWEIISNRMGCSMSSCRAMLARAR